MSKTRKEWLTESDLGLTYEEALHGVQTSIGMGFYKKDMIPKHLRTGVDMRAADALGLACLLIDKGLITSDEYQEYMRLAANWEVKHREDEVNQRQSGGPTISFR